MHTSCIANSNKLSRYSVIKMQLCIKLLRNITYLLHDMHRKYTRGGQNNFDAGALCICLDNTEFRVSIGIESPLL